MTFCAPLLSALSDRIGRKKVLCIALLGQGVAGLGAPRVRENVCFAA